MKDESKNVTITLQPAIVAASVGHPTVWTSDNFAEDWFADALQEARTSKDHNAVRREIIFATCFAESYIFEWTRRKVQIDELNEYFPPRKRFDNDPRYRRVLEEKWRDIPKELFEAGKIPSNPNLNLSGLGTMLKYRHGLVHAAASRPATDSQSKDTRPFPTKDTLKKLKPGWAVRIVVDLIKELHQSIGDPMPTYIGYP